MRERVSKINVKESLLAVNLNEGKNIRRVCELFFSPFGDGKDQRQHKFLSVSLIETLAHTYVHTHTEIQTVRGNGSSCVLDSDRKKETEMRGNAFIFFL